jgi:pantoate--beta-alanine ligase
VSGEGELVRDAAEMHRRAGLLRLAGKSIALVPTMGALHEGHLSLIRLAATRADVVVTSVFVNPTQFGEGEDYERYPRDLASDLERASSAGSDIVFAPEVGQIYGDDHVTYVYVERITEILEGRARPGHFRGVTTIVAKLFNIVRPNVAVFGQKDMQQAVVIKRMVSELNFGIDIVIGSTVREPDGLAMSSRNVYLSPDQRSEAGVLFLVLKRAQERIGAGGRSAVEITAEMKELINSRSSGIVEYISIAREESLEEVDTVPPGETVVVSLAVRFGTTRLIDNILARS